MKSPELESKRVFLVACHNSSISARVTAIIETQIQHPTIFHSTDGSEALFKADNVRPHVVIVEADLPKTDGFEVARTLMPGQGERAISVIILGELPEKERFVDRVVTGQIQFVSPKELVEKLPSALARALNLVSLEDKSHYRLRFLAKGETLFREGDVARSVFIVKSGELSARKGTKSDEIILGAIKPGEFVGEMAHINDDLRSATVRSETDCELIEIPRGTLDTMLFTKPVWAKALIETLSKRLRNSNELVVTKP